VSLLHKSKGIVLKTVKYGETSLVVSIYTELFGIQTYMVNGVRTSSKKGMGKANLFQPASQLDLVIYNNQFKNLQRLKEYKWSHLYQSIFFDISKTAVALFMVELLQKTIKQPECNPELFYFIEDAFLHLDRANPLIAANFPLYFAMHLPSFFGFRMNDDYSDHKSIIDLMEGNFTNERPSHTHYLEGNYSLITSQLLKILQPHELEDLKLNREFRLNLLRAYQDYYAIHVQDFGSLKTLPVLHEIL
jgi:DNA repair protein RecO (recombination protein O)